MHQNEGAVSRYGLDRFEQYLADICLGITRFREDGTCQDQVMSEVNIRFVFVCHEDPRIRLGTHTAKCSTQ